MDTLLFRGLIGASQELIDKFLVSSRDYQEFYLSSFYGHRILCYWESWFSLKIPDATKWKRPCITELTRVSCTITTAQWWHSLSISLKAHFTCHLAFWDSPSTFDYFSFYLWFLNEIWISYFLANSIFSFVLIRISDYNI